MKTKSLMIAIALFALVMGMTASAYAATITPIVSADAAGTQPLTQVWPGQRFWVIAQVKDAINLAGAAFTLTYNKDLFDVIKQVPPTSTTPLGEGVPITTTGEIDRGLDILNSDAFISFNDDRTGAAVPQDVIRLANLDAANGKIMLSGAGINRTAGAGATGTMNLFKIRFRAKTTSGIGTFVLQDTVLTNTTAGWNGTAVPALVGAVSNTDSNFNVLDYTKCPACAFPPIAYSYGSAASITVLDATTKLPGDLDGNGIVDVRDVRQFLYFLNKKAGISQPPGNLDLDHNGIIDIKDVRALLYYLNKKQGYDKIE